MLMGRWYVRKSLLRVKHHLLVCPLCELGVSWVEIGCLLGYLCRIRLRRLLLLVILVERGIKGRCSDGRGPAALGLLLDWI